MDQQVFWYLFFLCVNVPMFLLLRERNVRHHRATDLPNSDHIKTCYLHVRNIRKEFLDSEELAATDKFDIIAITESWLNTKDRNFNAEYNLPGYSIFSCNRKNRVRGGLPVESPWIVTMIFIHVQYSLKKINNIDLIFVELSNHKLVSRNK